MVAVKSSLDAADLMRGLFNQDTLEWTEEMILVCLNSANVPIGWFKVSSGGISGTLADPRVIFTMALNACAASIIVAHNHPSGNPSPSPGDMDITRKIVKSGEVLGIKVLDHIIITREGHYSFAGEGSL